MQFYKIALQKAPKKVGQAAPAQKNPHFPPHLPRAIIPLELFKHEKAIPVIMVFAFSYFDMV